MEQEDTRQGGVPGGDVLERLATVPRAAGEELRVELQAVPHGPPVVALRVWRLDEAQREGEAEALPRRARGFTLRAYELRPVIVAFVQALDRFREEERTRRLDRPFAEHRRQRLAAGRGSP